MTLELLRRELMCFTAPMFEYGYMCVMGGKVLRNMTQTGLSLVLLPLASSQPSVYTYIHSTASLVRSFLHKLTLLAPGE